jgi:multimeric flavodoxin WrbA
MKAIILDGSNSGDVISKQISEMLIEQLESQGWETENVVIRDKKIGVCAGYFYCWIRSPGICNINDDNRIIAEAVIASDLVVYLTPITFGGYSSKLKGMVDHLIQNISPHFTTINGETHHKKRYSKYPDFVVVGWMDSPDISVEMIFKYLVRRNAINFYAEKAISAIVYANQSNEEVKQVLNGSLSELQNRHTQEPVQLPKSVIEVKNISEIKKALLIVGSPRTRNSTSNSLGQYLLQQLDVKSVKTETIYLYHMIRSSEKMQELFEKINDVDLITLAFPTYVDSLPSPVISLLEQIVNDRNSREQVKQPVFTAIANCGFPEAVHNATAEAICETFARIAKFEWGGSLALGGGEMIQGKPLDEAGSRATRTKKSLEIAAIALAEGEGIPTSAKELMSKQVVPAWAYRLLGGLGWKQRAKPYRAGKLLNNQPYIKV